MVSLSIVIFGNLTWTAHVHGQPLTSSCPAISQIPPVLTLASFKSLVLVLTTNSICVGHSDATFIEMAESRGGKLLSQRNEVVSYLDRHCKPCIRHKECELLVNEEVCTVCNNYRSNLRAMLSRFLKSKASVHHKTNIRYMNSCQKRARLLIAKAALRNKQRQLGRLKTKLKELTKKQGVEISDGLSGDFSDVIRDYDGEIKKLPANNFKRVFWEQQVSYLSTHHAIAMDYHNRCQQSGPKANAAEGGTLCLFVGA